ncbi:MAG: HAD hydrolase family protein [Deltaproteobacteria bacterium]|nr:HAD hydrolase family protein [Deltaproteobacteria bacterium]
MEEKAARIKMLFLDVDGVLTDGGITINPQGDEIKTFDVKDGQGLKMLASSGVEVIFVSGRKSQVLEHRARDLGIDGLYQAVDDKKALCRQLIAENGLKKEQVCSMGDDLPDLAMFSESGLCIAVADAVREVRGAADLITRCKGGRGAVREACEWLLKCQGKWDDALAAFT